MYTSCQAEYSPGYRSPINQSFPTPSGPLSPDPSKFVNSRSVSVSLAQRSQIILLGFDGLNNEAIESEIGPGHYQVGRWRKRWRDNWRRLIGIECTAELHELKNAIKEWLADARQ